MGAFIWGSDFTHLMMAHIVNRQRYDAELILEPDLFRTLDLWQMPIDMQHGVDDAESRQWRSSAPPDKSRIGMPAHVRQ